MKATIRSNTLDRYHGIGLMIPRSQKSTTTTCRGVMTCTPLGMRLSDHTYEEQCRGADMQSIQFTWESLPAPLAKGLCIEQRPTFRLPELMTMFRERVSDIQNDCQRTPRPEDDVLSPHIDLVTEMRRSASASKNRQAKPILSPTGIVRRTR